MILCQTQDEQSEVILRTHLLNRTAREARTPKQGAGTSNINCSLQRQRDHSQHSKGSCKRKNRNTKTNVHRIDCNRRTRLAHTRRMLLPHAQHCHDDVQRTYKLQQRRIQHHAKASKPNRIKSNPAREAAIQASACVCQP